jgi:hypothetical protein
LFFTPAAAAAADGILIPPAASAGLAVAAMGQLPAQVTQALLIAAAAVVAAITAPAMVGLELLLFATPTLFQTQQA